MSLAVKVADGFDRKAAHGASAACGWTAFHEFILLIN